MSSCHTGLLDVVSDMEDRMRNTLLWIRGLLMFGADDEGSLADAELSRDEWRAEIDKQTRALLDMPSESFVLKLSTGELDRRDWRVEYLSGLVE